MWQGFWVCPRGSCGPLWQGFSVCPRGSCAPCVVRSSVIDCFPFSSVSWQRFIVVEALSLVTTLSHKFHHATGPVQGSQTDRQQHLSVCPTKSSKIWNHDFFLGFADHFSQYECFDECANDEGRWTRAKCWAHCGGVSVDCRLFGRHSRKHHLVDHHQ